jgi:hypothetical protein
MLLPGDPAMSDEAGVPDEAQVETEGQEFKTRFR